jgi:hypothetical protein
MGIFGYLIGNLLESWAECVSLNLNKLGNIIFLEPLRE